MPQDTGPARFSDEELLSYAQGRAPKALAQAIDAARQQDPALAAELSVMAALPRALEASSLPNAAGEFGWRRFEAEAKRTPQLPHRAASRGGIWRVAALVFGLAALGQAAYLVNMGGGAAPGYVTVSDAVAEHGLAVGFAPEARMDQITVLMREIKGRLVDGPGATGLYRVAFDDAAALESGRQTLEAAAIVALVLEQ